MKKVLVITYQYPPFASPGVQRTINLVNYLPEFGYEPVVFTLSEDEWENLGVFRDNSLYNLLKNPIKVYRGRAYSINGVVQSLMKLRIYRLFWFAFFPVLWEGAFWWSILSYRKVSEIFEKEKCELVYTTSGPFSSMLLGYRLKRKWKTKWVADLRDPFTDAYVWQFPSKIHWYLSRIFERWLFSKPDALIVNTDEVKKLYQEREYLSRDKIFVVNNGY